MSKDRFQAEPALAPLKDFQRRTVDYVFNRLYRDDDPVRQFLVADEVGLGKTMIARGVIARTIEELWDTTERIDIIYICSNQAIAAQNIRRLNVLGREDLVLPTRMTLIPLQLRGDKSLDRNKVNFISLTPGTSFNLRSSGGKVEERTLLFHLLATCTDDRHGLRNVLQVGAGVESWRQAVDAMSLSGIDEALVDRFQRDVADDVALVQELAVVCTLFHRTREKYPDDFTKRRNALVGELRLKLSRACVDALQPDLIIVDEFQRFRELLHGDDVPARLARELFDYRDDKGAVARTLLLSATPYRMLTLSHDDEAEGDHYRDFLETLAFLYGREKGPGFAVALEQEMRRFRGFLHGLPETHGLAVEARRDIEAKLRKVMARTERVGRTLQRDSMVSEPAMRVTIDASDLRQAAAVARIARIVEAPEIIEYWKSAPYLLNFMRDYQLKKLLKARLESPDAVLRDALEQARHAMLDREALGRYEPIKPANGRMRALMDDLFADGLDQHLWIPPSMPYYGGPTLDKPLTKALVFSSWSMVPDAIAALLSHEAERRMGLQALGRNYFEPSRSRPIRFQQDQERRAGLRTMHLIYPSPTLARLGDPLPVFLSTHTTIDVEAMRKEIRTRLRSSFDALAKDTVEGADGRDWEWAAPAVIDATASPRAREWLRVLGRKERGDGDEGFREHVVELSKAAETRAFGPPSDEVLEILIDIALGSPAVCALRALHRVVPALELDDPLMMDAAVIIAWGFRTLYNQHDVIALLRQDTDDRYWRRVLTFGAEHHLQAVLDEYVHYLIDAEGLARLRPAEQLAGLSKAISSALEIRPSQIDVDDPLAEGDGLAKFQMRGRFAMRLADYIDEQGAAERLVNVRNAFNSPFRPFALASTSVGQEGLDFHPYCYRVYHWNLPGNPVDLEQREGRVHRFKGHAIRLNVAHRQIDKIRGPETSSMNDPWQAMFEAARSESDSGSDLIPYWIYEGPVKVERRVPLLPFSREVERLEWLKRSLTVYRLAFGQPRQEDLLAYLNRLVGQDAAELDGLADLQIELEP